jgi:hypothetical protein
MRERAAPLFELPRPQPARVSARGHVVTHAHNTGAKGVHGVGQARQESGDD